MKTEVNPEMLILARELRGLSQTELAIRSGIDQGKLSRYEADMVTVSDDDLYKLSDVLDFPTLFFSRTGDRFGSESGEIFHRKRKTTTSKELRHLHARLNLMRLNMQKLLEAVDVDYPNTFPNFNLHTFRGSVEDIAAAVRQLWKLPPGPIRNLMKVLEDAFCVIYVSDFGTDKIDEITQWVEPMPPMMLVNRQAPGDRLRFSMAHALGHLVMHHNLPPYPSMENEADRFAAAFLMPENDIKSELKPVTIEHLIELKPAWKVSLQALLYRAHDIGLITKSRLKMLFEMLSRAGYRLNEPVPIPVERPTLFGKLILHYQSEFRYSTREIAQLLSITEDHFRDLYFPGEAELRFVSRNPVGSDRGYRSDNWDEER